MVFLSFAPSSCRAVVAAKAGLEFRTCHYFMEAGDDTLRRAAREQVSLSPNRPALPTTITSRQRDVLAQDTLLCKSDASAPASKTFE
jgi:hypothetical protein